MRFFKSHPALAALAAVAVLTLLGGAAYAVVREVFVTIDPDQSAPEIQQSLQQQLEAAGVPSSVHVDKSDEGQLKVRIGTSDPAVGSDLKINVNGMPAETRALRMQIELACQAADMEKCAGANDLLEATASSPAIVKLVTDRGDEPDADVAAAITKIFHDAGFLEVDVSVGEGTVTIAIKAPPVTK